MAALIERIKGRITGYDERTHELLIRAPYDDFPTLCRREYENVIIQPIDSRPLSDKQRRACYAMIGEIADYMGDTQTAAQDIMGKAYMRAQKRDQSEAVKEWAKLKFWCDEVHEMAEEMFSLHDAPMSIVAGFQKWLARFIVREDIPTKLPMLDYVDDVKDYILACIINKKCVICGRMADLHHLDAVGAGRDRDEIIHEGLEVITLCREHHTEIHTIGKTTFCEKYHIPGGVAADKTICRMYGLKVRRQKRDG